ncbi:MAG: DUF2804 domain-containing protein [Spirochaetaceae bacterium]|jgi:hypothetical protein|nr:DUF2804 domain-containing protein [Spirochaetaceae bacterium]
MTGCEITETLPVLDAAGKPAHFGWARKALFEYNPPDVGGAPVTRITEADRYIIFSATHLIVFEVMNGGILSHVGISIISVKDHKRSTHNFEGFLPFSRFELPRSSEAGSIRVREKKSALDFILMKNGARIIKVDYPRFGHHRYLRGEVVLSSPAETAQSIVTVSPWRREKYAFRYFRCSPWFITEGVMQFGTGEIYFTKDNAWGIYDWKREVRPRRDIRYWAAACGMAGGALVGFNVGYGSADSSAGTENAFFLNGVIHKLDQVTFHIPPTNWLEEWKFTSNDKRLEMTFTPNQQREEWRSIFLHSVKCRQVCGTFSGRVILDDGSSHAFWNITGFAERRKTRL